MESLKSTVDGRGVMQNTNKWCNFQQFDIYWKSLGILFLVYNYYYLPLYIRVNTVYLFEDFHVNYMCCYCYWKWHSLINSLRHSCHFSWKRAESSASPKHLRGTASHKKDYPWCIFIEFIKPQVKRPSMYMYLL